MCLRRLPPEILVLIFTHLGSAFFCQDARRLVVAKWWYHLAWPVLLHDLDLSAESLRDFILAARKPGVASRIRHHVRTVRLRLGGFEGWRWRQVVESGSTYPIEIDLEVVNTWTSELNGCLAALAGLLQQSTRLRSLKLEARLEKVDPVLGTGARDYLMAVPQLKLASINYLTSLDMDLVGTHLIGQIEDNSLHLCGSISAMLPNLRRLRCRMRTICPRLLEAPGDDDTPLHLEHVVVNLNLPYTTSGRNEILVYPARCEWRPGTGLTIIKTDVEAQARELVQRMANPRCVRVVSHVRPAYRPVSFDAVTGRRMLLAEDAPWDADGEEVEEMGTHNYLFDSDSESDSETGSDTSSEDSLP